ncbi:phage Gp37/Gp68 family protein [Azospirillum doebereinerae]|uniref:phage Gp37/Gp68 family protein n=1 Tax=Azospirillum doebereinerae TaxID=92933 RepID=UPI001EE51F94|nr:phage Gp37/Gp68 family protein [Azospirillum doebereinerae]MCG5239546.1 phage Gp37/Gp68 family protein [Azospirillum doebereinerae]
MGDHCTIEWLVALAQARNAIPASINPIRGCSRASEGCRNCYAAAIAHRFGHKGNGIWAGLTDLDPAGVPRFNGTLRFVWPALRAPIKAKRSRVYFVCDMADLFHARVPDDWIDQVFAMMALCRHHLFLLLTKRPDRMRRYLTDPKTPGRIAFHADVLGLLPGRAAALHHANGPDVDDTLPNWPLPNVWTGATVEDQAAANERVPELLGVPSVLRFLSVEPMLGPVDLTALEALFWDVSDHEGRRNALTGELYIPGCAGESSRTLTGGPRLGWVIAGGESGPNARPCHPDWFRDLRDDCVEAGVPFFFKQWGEWAPGECGSHPPTRTERTAELINDAWAYGSMTPQASRELHRDDEPDLYRLSKRGAGRVFDGVTWGQVPEVQS